MSGKLDTYEYGTITGDGHVDGTSIIVGGIEGMEIMTVDKIVSGILV